MSIEEFKKLKIKKSKYGNEKTIYKGEKYDSKREADYSKMLDTLKHSKNRAERVLKVERQVRYPIFIGQKHICNYYSDFRVRYGNGREEVIDVKGYKTEVYKIKKKLVEAIYQFKIIEI